MLSMVWSLCARCVVARTVQLAQLIILDAMCNTFSAKQGIAL